MTERYNGWRNWETWNFANYEMDNIEYDIDDDMTIEDIENEVQATIDNLIDDSGAEGVALDFMQASFDRVDTREIAEVLYDILHG